MPSASGRRRVGVMGGTFDPIHHGHLVAASEVQDVFDLDEVVFVPTGAQPFKLDREVTSVEHRYLMTVIATASNPRFTVSRVDIDRPGITYTIDTLRDLRAQMPEDELFFITGADAMSQILEWKNSAELFELAHFIGVTRPGHALDDTGLPERAPPSSRCPRSPSPRPTAGPAWPPVRPCGTSCRTAWSSTSRSTSSTGGQPPRRDSGGEG